MNVVTGSLLVGKTEEECSLLWSRAQQLRDAGLAVELLSSEDLLLKEPALVLGKEAGAAFLPDDYQLDARVTIEFIKKVSLLFSYLLEKWPYCLLLYLNL